MERSSILSITLALTIALVATFFWWKQRAAPAAGAGNGSTMTAQERKTLDAFHDLPNALALAAHIGSTGHEGNWFSRAYTLVDVQFGLPAGKAARDLPSTASRKLREPGTAPEDRAIAFMIERKFRDAETAALQARDETKGKDRAPDMARALRLAGLAAERQWRNGRRNHPKALEHYQAAAVLTRKDSEFFEWLRVQNHIGSALEWLDRAEEAEKLLTNAIKDAQSKTPPLGDHALVQQTRCLLATVQWALKKYPESEKTCREVVSINERMLGPEHPVTLQNRSALGTTLSSLEGRTKEGDRILLEVYEARKRVLGVDHSDTLLSRMDEAEKHRRHGRLDEAAAEYRAVAEARDRKIGPLEPESCYAWSKLSNYYYQEDKYAECEAIERKQMELQERGYGVGNRDALNSCYMLMLALQGQNKIEEAQALARRAVVTAKQSLKDERLREKILELAEELEVPVN